MPLPEFLQPSIPTKSNAAWRNAEQRAADRVAKLAAAGLVPPPMPVRWLRVPDAGGGGGGGDADGEEGAGGGEEGAAPACAAAAVELPAVLPQGEGERQLCGLEEFHPDPDPAATSGALAGLASPPKRPGGWAKRAALVGEDGLPLAAGGKRGYAPHSQEARDAKSGKGRKRLFLHPVIRSRDRCGQCPVRLRLGRRQASGPGLALVGLGCACVGSRCSAQAPRQPPRAPRLFCCCPCFPTTSRRPPLATPPGLHAPALEEGLHDAARGAGGGRGAAPAPRRRLARLRLGVSRRAPAPRSYAGPAAAHLRSLRHGALAGSARPLAACAGKARRPNTTLQSSSEQRQSHPPGGAASAASTCSDSSPAFITLCAPLPLCTAPCPPRECPARPPHLARPRISPCSLSLPLPSFLRCPLCAHATQTCESYRRAAAL